MSKINIFVIVLLLAVFSAMTFAQREKIYSRQIPNYIFGTWEVYRYKSSGGTLHSPDGFLGKQVTFRHNSMNCDQKFLFFDYPCKLNKYEYKDYRPDPYEVNKGIMLWGTEDGLSHRERLLLACYDKRPNYCYYFEIDKRNQLMVYYDGWMYFLKKVKNTRSKPRIAQNHKKLAT